MANLAPGIIIQELASTSLAIQQSATAVPVFIGRFISADGAGFAHGKCLRVNSWFEFTRLSLEPSGYTISLPYTPPAEREAAADIKPKKLASNDIRSDTDYVSDAYATPCFSGEKLLFTVSLIKPSPGNRALSFTANPEYAGVSTAVVNVDYADKCKYYTNLSPARIDTVLEDNDWESVNLEKGVSTVYFEVQTSNQSVHEGASPYLNIKFAMYGDSSYEDRIKIARGDILYAAINSSSLMSGFFSLFYYFQNGGGPCYILPMLVGDAGELARLPTAIEECPDVTLLVCTETDESLSEINTDKNAVYSALTPLLTPDKGYFLIADAENNGTAPTSLVSSDRSAVYYPNVLTSFKRTRPLDESVSIFDYEDVKNLSELSVKNPDVYNFINKHFEQLMGEKLTLPPSALVAGVYASTDRERGVWKAPANIVLKGVNTLDVLVSPLEHGSLNESGINVIRWFSSRGPVIYGARTLAVDSFDWCYVPVRRLFNSVERDTKAALRVLLFEPNNEMTWERARSSIYNYLTAIWQEGGLVGSKASEAFFVHVGLGTTMNKTQVEEGMLIVEIGMAAVRPAEFIILKFTQNQQ